jgi:hypothetical protein
MYPKAHACSWTLTSGYGTHLAAGNSLEYSGDCSTSCDDLADALDETNYGFARSSATTGTRNNGRVEFTFGDPPQNVTIVSLTLVAWVRTSSANTAVIDSSPTLSFFTNPSGTRTYQTGTQTITATCNRNTQTAVGRFQKLTYTWTARPAGGAWTRADLLSGTFQAGFESSATSGYGSGIDATTGGSSASLDWASVYIELETTPSGLYTDPVRVVLSHQLRTLRRPLRRLRVAVPHEFGEVEPGQTVWSSHDLLPWSPGMRSWEHVPLYCLEVEDHVSPPTRTLTLLDPREQYVNFWSPFAITGVDESNTGLAVWHLGGGWSTSRAQVAFAPRPGDGLYQEVAQDSPLLTKDGLLIQGGSDKNHLLDSTFSQGSSDTFTSWTKTTSGSATITQDVTDYLIDTSGFRRSAKTTTTASGENCYLSQTVSSIAANTKLFVRAWYKNDSGADAYFIQVKRGVDSNYWNGSTWQASAHDLRPTLASTISRYTSGQIDVGGSTTDITVYMGHYSAVATGANTGHIYALELQLGTTFSWCRRDLLPTTTAAVTRVADQTSLNNEADYRIFPASRGFFVLDYSPQWSHSDLANGQYVGILQHAVNGFPSPAGLLCYYYRTDSTSGLWVWRSASFATSSAASTLPQAGTSYRIAARMTSEADDEHDLAGQAFDIWVDGVRGTGSTSATELTPTVPASISLGAVEIEIPPRTVYYADGHIGNLSISSRCPTDAEMARM